MMRWDFVVFLIGFAAATFDYTGRATLEDVIAFFNTTDKILLAKRSYSLIIGDNDPRCIYTKTTAVKDNQISLIEHYDYHQRSELHCIANRVFMDISKKPGMDVAPVLRAAKVKAGFCPLPSTVVTTLTKAHSEGAFDYSGSATLQDVKDFFSTSKNILLLARSYTHRINGYEPMCIYNEKWSISTKPPISIVVLQHYRYGDKSRQYAYGYPVYYTLSRNPGMDDAPLMRATNRSDEKGEHPQENKKERMYFFNYYDPVMKCAVITFTDNSDSTKCELHIWEEKYGLPIENCKREFVYRCPHHPYYFPSEDVLCPLGNKYKLAKGSFQLP